MAKHRVGSSIHDLVIGGSVRDGIDLTCGSCNRGFAIVAPRGQFTNPDEFGEYHCPYCGHKSDTKPRDPHMGGRIIDIRPSGDD